MRVLAGVYNPIAFDGRVQRACEAEAELGPVELVCPAGPATPQPPGVTVHEVTLPHGPAAGVRRYAVFWGRFVRLAWRMRPGVIHAHDCFMAFPGWVASRLTGARLVYDAHELRVPGSRVALLRPRALAWYLLDRLAVRHADLVIAANGERAEVMQRHYGLARLPTVVRNFPAKVADAGRVDQGAGRVVPEEGLRGVRWVYQGDLSLRRGIGTFLSAFAYLPGAHRLTLIGGGPDHDALQRLADEEPFAGRVTLTGRVTRAELDALLGEHDIGIVCYSFQGLNDVYCAPNKIFEYAHAGLPVVATAQPPLRSMVEGYGIGQVVEAAATAQEAAVAMLRIAEELESFRSRLRAFLEDHDWSRERLVLREAVRSLSAPE